MGRTILAAMRLAARTVAQILNDGVLPEKIRKRGRRSQFWVDEHRCNGATISHCFFWALEFPTSRIILPKISSQRSGARYLRQISQDVQRAFANYTSLCTSHSLRCNLLHCNFDLWIFLASVHQHRMLVFLSWQETSLISQVPQLLTFWLIRRNQFFVYTAKYLLTGVAQHPGLSVGSHRSVIEVGVLFLFPDMQQQHKKERLQSSIAWWSKASDAEKHAPPRFMLLNDFQMVFSCIYREVSSPWYDCYVLFSPM